MKNGTFLDELIGLGVGTLLLYVFVNFQLWDVIEFEKYQALWNFVILVVAPTLVAFVGAQLLIGHSFTIRGSTMDTSSALGRWLHRKWREWRGEIFFKIGKYDISMSQLTQGLMYLGAQGSGKTNAILALLAQLVYAQRYVNEKIKIIYLDSKEYESPDFRSKFYLPQFHVVFSPRSQNASTWDFGEDVFESTATMKVAHEAIVSEQLATVTGNGKHFVELASQTLWLIFLDYWSPNPNGANEKKTPRNFIDYLNTLIDKKTTRGILKDTGMMWGIYIDGMLDDSAQGDGVWASVLLWLNQLKSKNIYTQYRNVPFLFTSRDIVDDGSYFSSLFLQYHREAQVEDKLWFRMLLGLIIYRIQNLPNNPQIDKNKRLIVLVLDEVQTLGAMPELLTELQATARSKGVVVIFGTQNLAKMKSIVGEELMQAMLSNAKTKIIFQLADDYSASVAESLAGAREEIDHRESKSNTRSHSHSHTESTSAVIRKSDTVMASQFIGLKPLQAYIIGLGAIKKQKFKITKISHEVRGVDMKLLPNPPFEFFGKRRPTWKPMPPKPQFIQQYWDDYRSTFPIGADGDENCRHNAEFQFRHDSRVNEYQKKVYEEWLESQKNDKPVEKKQTKKAFKSETPPSLSSSSHEIEF